jgi:type I restriction enzyme S subunit
MSNDWFFEKFALIADAPCAVERMRELVLYLAVRGQLVAREFRDIWATENLAELQPSELELSPRFDTPENWIWAPLDALLSKMKNGYSGKPNKSGGHYKVTRIETIARGTIDTDRIGFADDLPVEVVEKHLIMKGDILFSHINSEPHLGKTAICTSNDPTLIHGVNLLLMRTIPLIDPQYLNTVFKELRASGYFVSIAQRAINQSSINQKNLGKTLIPIPPLAEQKRIVAKVEELMGMCDELEAQQQERELRKSVLVRSSLSRFAESPTRENLGYLFHNSYDIPPSELRKSILTLAVQGLLVAHDSESAVWETRKLKDLTTKIGSGSTPSGGKESYQASGVPLIRSMNVHFGGFVRQGLAFLNDEQAEKLKNVAVKADDVLLNITGASIGRVATAPRNMEGARVNQHVCIVRPTSAITPQFLELFLASPVVQNLIDAVQVGATREALTKTMIEQFEIPVPSVGEQRRIVAKVDQLMALVDELERQQEASREKASKLLDAIVQEMTSGGRDIAATLES